MTNENINLVCPICLESDGLSFDGIDPDTDEQAYICSCGYRSSASGFVSDIDSDQTDHLIEEYEIKQAGGATNYLHLPNTHSPRPPARSKTERTSK